MTYLRDNSFLKSLLQFLPITLLFISVLNEFDANYFGIPFLSFNFAFILIFFWTLKKLTILDTDIFFWLVS